MTLKELKKSILDNTFNGNLLILKYDDFDVIPREYAERIAKNYGISVKYIDDLNESIVGDSLFGSSDDEHTLNVLCVDKLDLSEYRLSVEDMKMIKREDCPTVVICNKIATKGLDEYTVEIPKLQDWQILSYMEVKGKGIDKRKLKWLYDVSKGNLYRIDSELRKLSCFNENMRDKMFDMVSDDDGYSDLSNLNIFNLSGGILANDKKQINDVLNSIDSIDINSYGLVTLMYNDVKSMISIKSSKATYESLGISYGKFNRLKNDLIKDNNKLYTMAHLVKIFEFLSNYDYELKSGNLDLDDKRIIDYIVCTITTILDS